MDPWNHKFVCSMFLIYYTNQSFWYKENQLSLTIPRTMLVQNVALFLYWQPSFCL